MKKMKNDRTGECFITNEGYSVIIINYENANSIYVQFQDKYKAIVHTRYDNCKKGRIKNPYHPSVYGIGCLGQGKYCSSINGKENKMYRVWIGMFNRCYNESLHKKYETYKGCTVCEQWHNFQNFGEWYEKNYYEIDGERMELDKDILKKGNKIYGPETCIFVPHRINSLFIKSDKTRGDLPIGVSYSKSNEKYQVQCNNGRELQHLGFYDNIEEAFLVYKSFKEQCIRITAEEYKNIIPKKLYQAMNNYYVEFYD